MMLSWQEKLRITHEAVERFPELVIVFHENKGANESFIRQVQREFHFVDREYISFLRQMDGGYFSSINFFGSGSNGFTSLFDMAKFWKRILRDDGVAIA